MTTMKQDLTRYGIEIMVTTAWVTLVMMYANIEKVAPYYYSDWTFTSLLDMALHSWQLALIFAFLMWIYLRRHYTSTEYGSFLVLLSIVTVIGAELFYAITKAIGVW